MKKLLCLALTLALLTGAAALPALAEEYADCTCAEQRFATKVPLSGTAGYENNTGLVIYTDVPGYIPYVIVNRRPMDKKFSNPVNYLNNVYREYLEEKHEDLSTSPAETLETDGRKLLGARYTYRIGQYTVCHMQLIEIRDGGDVEYTAKYIEGEDAATMAALDAAVRYYRETDTEGTDPPSPKKGEETPETSGPVLEPVSAAGTEADLQNGTYWARITDTEHITDGGFFTVELYESDRYAAGDVENLKPGDRVKLNGQIYTVRTFQPWMSREGVYQLTPEEAFDGWMGFEKGEGDFYYGTVGDWHVSSFVTDTTVFMPLANDFVFVYAVSENDVTRFDADRFVSLLSGKEAWLREEELTEDCTAVRFTDGLLTAIVHREK